MTIDPKLIEFATVRQIEYIEAIEKHGSARKAAKALGVAKSAVTDSIARLRAHAAR
jgi:DNA-binding transcriptional LysR family regulator